MSALPNSNKSRERMRLFVSVQHVVPVKDGWGVQEEHEPDMREVFVSEDEAVHHAYHAAGAGGSVIVHDMDGQKHEYLVV